MNINGNSPVSSLARLLSTSAQAQPIRTTQARGLENAAPALASAEDSAETAGERSG